MTADVPSGPTRFLHLSDRDTAPMDNLLRAACEPRGIDFTCVWLPTFDFVDPPRTAPGDLLFRSATSAHAQLVEQSLWRPGLRTFYRRERRLFAPEFQPLLRLERAGLPTPRTIYSLRPQPALLAGYVQHLGGFPVVLKVPGGEGGVGVMQVDSMPALLSLVDFLEEREAQLQELVAEAVVWRVIVVGAQAPVAYRHVVPADDFRSRVIDAPDAAHSPAPAALAALALEACACLDLAFGGVDLLETSGGRRLVLEVNFPCYWPFAQELSGVDVAGAMLDWLTSGAPHPPAEHRRTR